MTWQWIDVYKRQMVGGAIVMGIGVYILGSEKGKVNSLNNKAI